MEDLQTTKNETQQHSILPMVTISILSVLVIILCIVMFVYGNFSGISKKELNRNYIEKTKITFSDLPYSSQQNYVLKSIYDSDLENAKKVAQMQAQNLATTTQDEIKTPEVKPVEEKQPLVLNEEKNKKVVKEEINKEKVVKDNKALTNIAYDESDIDRSKFDYYKCYKMDVGDYRVSDECKQALKTFVKKHKNSPLFEVIGVSDSFDFKIVDAVEDSPTVRKKFNISQDDIDRYKLVNVKGLAGLRVKETIWEMKQLLGESAQIIPTSYYIESRNHSRGTIIRAYYPKTK